MEKKKKNSTLSCNLVIANKEKYFYLFLKLHILGEKIYSNSEQNFTWLFD